MDVKCLAEVKAISCRAEAAGDEYVPALDVTLMLLLVEVERIGALCPGLKDWAYTDTGHVAIGEVNPLTVHHKLQNLRVEIGGVVISGADIKKGAKIHLQPNHMANVELKVSCRQTGTRASDLMGMLRTEVPTKIAERQLSVVGMEQ